MQTRSVRRPPSFLPTAPSKAHWPQGISTFWPLCWPNTTVNPELAPFHSTPPYHHPHASRLPPPTPGSSFMPHHVMGQTSCCCHLRSPLRFTLSSPCLGLVFLPPNSPCRCVHAALQTTAQLTLLRMGYRQLRPPTTNLPAILHDPPCGEPHHLAPHLHLSLGPHLLSRWAGDPPHPLTQLCYVTSFSTRDARRREPGRGLSGSCLCNYSLAPLTCP